MTKTVQSYTVRNAQGQYLGTFHATSAPDAIRKFIESQAVTAAAFRKSQPLRTFPGLTASVEGR